MMKGPTRTQIQRSRGYTGPPATIGPAPKSSPEPTDLRYRAIKTAKQALDRRTVAAREEKRTRARSAGAMKPRSRGDAIRNGNGNGGDWDYVPNGVVYGPAEAPAANGAASWWGNPYLWAAVLGLYFFTRKGKK